MPLLVNELCEASEYIRSYFLARPAHGRKVFGRNKVSLVTDVN